MSVWFYRKMLGKVQLSRNAHQIDNKVMMLAAAVASQLTLSESFIGFFVLSKTMNHSIPVFLGCLIPSAYIIVCLMQSVLS